MRAIRPPSEKFGADSRICDSQGPASDAYQATLTRLIADGEELTSQLTALLHSRGSRSEAVETLHRIFRAGNPPPLT